MRREQISTWDFERRHSVVPFRDRKMPSSLSNYLHTPYYLPWNDQAFQESRCAEHSTRLHVEKPTDEVASSPSELRLPACGETAAKLISVGGRRFKRLPAVGGDVEHATIAAVVRGI